MLAVAPLITSFFLGQASETDWNYFDQYVKWDFGREEYFDKMVNDDNFEKVNDRITVKIVFGLLNIPPKKWRTPAEKWWAEEIERELFTDDKFDISHPKNQQFLVDFCNRLVMRTDLVH